MPPVRRSKGGAWRGRVALVFAGLLASSSVATAQGASDSAYARAQRMVAAGDGAGARALVDSVLSSIPEGSAPYAEALFWRATLAATAAEAERDYRRVCVEYPLSPRAEEALFRLAQLELVRADRAGAVRHLQRLLREHPGGTTAARGSYELARAFFDSGDEGRGCGALALAQERVTAADVELRNRIEYYTPRCAGVTAVSPLSGGPPVVAGAPAGAPPGATPPTPPATASAPNERRPAAAPGGAAGARLFSVQVAAFTKTEQATALAEVLVQRGYEARVWGTAAPFRVRVGRVATREDAEALRERLQRSRINGVVVEAEAEAR